MIGEYFSLCGLYATLSCVCCLEAANNDNHNAMEFLCIRQVATGSFFRHARVR